MIRGRVVLSDLELGNVPPAFLPEGIPAERFCTFVVAQSDSSFVQGVRLLPTHRKRALYVLYAFLRTVDDVVDSTLGRDQKRAVLDIWRREIDAVFDGQPQSDIGVALERVVVDFTLPKEEIVLFLDGMEMDLDGPITAPPLEEFWRYTRRVAGAVGALCVIIFGLPRVPAAKTLGLTVSDAFQVTNILRDIEEDAEMGRLYLPREILTAHGIHDTDPFDVMRHDRFRDVCADVGGLARQKFRSGFQQIRAFKRSEARPALMMMGVYQGYLDRMEHLGWRRDRGKIRMSRTERLWRSLRYGYWPLRVAPAS